MCVSGVEKTSIIPESATKYVKVKPLEQKMLISCVRSEVGAGIFIKALAIFILLHIQFPYAIFSFISDI